MDLRSHLTDPDFDRYDPGVISVSVCLAKLCVDFSERKVL